MDAYGMLLLKSIKPVLTNNRKNAFIVSLICKDPYLLEKLSIRYWKPSLLLVLPNVGG